MKPVNILLVEDNEGDILLITEALEEGKILVDFSVVRDGNQAIKYLEMEPPYSEANQPDLILLDINLPRKNGHEVLDFIKNSARHKQIPVIMLTTSSSEVDVLKSYRNNANCFISKPVDADDFLMAITSIENFWINLVTLPPKNREYEKRRKEY